MAIAVITILLLALTAFAAMAIQSQSPPKTLGLQDGMLRACPDKPNCLCSEAILSANVRNRSEPIAIFSGHSQKRAWQLLRQAVIHSGGTIEQERDGYLHATYSSRLFRFIDDFEARLDRQAGVIHLRSASRVGHSDFDANRKRVETIRREYLKGLSQQ
ncbi:Uncharacterized conserved protein, DUF1499 family [Mariprofundus ferrinatatus]|uniref:Uncharacterized conserved protein, DUF1499 family n=1 Tax=Mariprofundus ferrinatatus TaxID=1921087 RepID=A0A2K8L818_9PROT|nr:DUF1499 domain-containing protein [Mariprofundus ferrinatatus]ATX81074.1 Uncharacterized conserved protein, DUF1499 family [Mariprofundus ferrinatatus]